MKIEKIQALIDNAIENSEKKYEQKLKYEIKEICKEFIYILFADEADWKECYNSFGIGSYRNIKTLGSEIKERVIKTALEEFDTQYKEKAKEVVTGEEFIDCVIERINRKQIK